jgi:hypothetical protein
MRRRDIDGGPIWPATVTIDADCDDEYGCPNWADCDADCDGCPACHPEDFPPASDWAEDQGELELSSLADRGDCDDSDIPGPEVDGNPHHSIRWPVGIVWRWERHRSAFYIRADARGGTVYLGRLKVIWGAGGRW